MERITDPRQQGAITVPARCWKVMAVLPVRSNDLSRVGASTRVIAVDIPNTQAATALPWVDDRTSVDALESSTGLDFLSLVPNTVQAVVEGGWIVGRRSRHGITGGYHAGGLRVAHWR